MKKNDWKVLFSVVAGIIVLIVFRESLPAIVTSVKDWQSNRQKNMEYTYSVVVLSKTAEQEYEVKREIILEDYNSYIVDCSKERGTVIYMNKQGEVVEKNLETGMKEIVLKNYEGGRIAYSSERRTIVYRNEQGELVEKNFETGGEEILNIPEMKEWSAVQRYGEVYFQYTNNGYDLFFKVNDVIYLWERDENRVIKIVEDSSWDYQWLENGDLLFTRNIDYYSSELMLWYKKDEQVESIEKNLVHFILSEDRSILYGIQRWAKFVDVGYIIRDQLVEKNLQTGEYKILMDKYKSESYKLTLGDDNQLFYVEEKGKKRRKIICVDTETGKARRIYRTANRIVGIIVK